MDIRIAFALSYLAMDKWNVWDHNQVCWALAKIQVEMENPWSATLFGFHMATQTREIMIHISPPHCLE